ncbi:MAG: hypothetical protein QG612_2441 [Pseudomonadota bacterium]|nr:hypothetical protein [Pseudomonadota bacterium]
MARQTPRPPAFVLRPDARWPRLLRAAWAGSATLVLGWLLWHLATDAPVWPAPAGAVLLAGLLVQRRLSRPAPLNDTVALSGPEGDAAGWRLDGDPGQLERVIDADDWLLLRHRASAPARRSTWLALSRRDHPQDWHRLRCALRARSASTSPLPAEQ